MQCALQISVLALLSRAASAANRELAPASLVTEEQEATLLRSEAAEPEAPWYQSVDSFHFPHVAATDLNGTDPLSAIRNINADYVLVEFYAPWCPHCQHFAMDYERVAESMLQLDGSKKVVAATVDCVMFDDACDKMQVQAYPTMMWASKEAWLSEKPKVTKVELDYDSHNAKGVTKWVGKQLQMDIKTASKDQVASKYKQVLLQAQIQHSAAAQSSTSSSSGSKADTWDMQLSVALLLRSALEDVQADPGKKQILHDFVQLLQRRFPEETCRSSLVALSHRLSAGTPTADALEKDWQLCGTPWKLYGQRSWRSCRGSVPGKRGFTCGLWTLMHSMAARSDNASAMHDLQVMRHTIGSFFECEDCRNHFMSLPVHQEDGEDRAHLQRWWWRTHNLVNERVKGIEEKYGDGDAAFPKTQWPLNDLCESCQRRSTAVDGQGDFLAMRSRPGEADPWDPTEVVSFLDGFYGA